jgi:putative addiction module component (TIGR02574 family)
MEKKMEKCLTPSELKKLSVAERILMVQEIWDSIAAEPESLPVTQTQRTELDRRMASFNASPNEGRSWEEIKQRIQDPK